MILKKNSAYNKAAVEAGMVDSFADRVVVEGFDNQVDIVVEYIQLLLGNTKIIA